MYPWLTSPDGYFPLPSYFTLLMVGFMLATYIAFRLSKSQGIDPDDLLDLALYMLIAGLIGARLLHVLADGHLTDYVNLCLNPLDVEVPSFIHVPCADDADCVKREAGELCHPAALTCRPARDCFAALKFWHGGLAFYGGFVLAIFVGLRFLKRRGIAFLKMADLCSPVIAMGLVFGRMGCLLAGCCFGLVTDLPIGLEFPGDARPVDAQGRCPQNYDLLTTESGQKVCVIGSPALAQHVKEERLSVPARHSLSVHPTQLYEAVFCLVLFAYLLFWRRRNVRFTGQVFWEFSLWYGVGRFVVEVFRNDDRGVWLGSSLSTSQIIAIPFIALALVALVRGYRAPAVAPETSVDS